MSRQKLLTLLMAFLLAPLGFSSPQQPKFTGTWKQSGERCVPKRSGDVTRRIDLRGADLVVETTILRGSGPPRHAVQRYRIDGEVSVSTGADGDEFHTSVVWQDQSLVFAIEEHEDGRILHSKETWTLSANAAELQVQRQNLDGSMVAAQGQMLVYLRQPAEVAGRLRLVTGRVSSEVVL